ncbi:Cytochrome b561/ferric reductase transmembrane [Macrophomina phaseolina MS6]|uniref:Cytochrome b561/ferric reductase transmembrane n=2 Tax=Macrophomina phaseolina TaxID=35725 RepID=K2SAP3_MACPH|nr:Cytochrome b561/ferric reductase transmembrane [Macrophomina phaseolina MS6]KAH7052235.1 hypothetical protein B0J12DRAFT_68039 [Macrophomina phaseolina]
MSTDGLAPPGSSQYSSGTMYVGDGTWDSDRNTFLLPNLMGLNFDTMRYNGMGNRFKELSGYKSIIVGHGVVGAITFLGIVPAAIFMARFYHRNPRLALRMHIWLQILTVLLTTVVFTLGWFAVGPERSLTNPHHGIGLAIFVLVLVQAIGGGLIHHREKGRERFKIPLKLMMHQWFGRAIAILGFVQIPLGLTLWGSPKVLFILFALWGFALFLFYFILSYRNLPVGAFDDDGTYISDYTSVTEDRHSRRSHGRGLGALAAAGAAGAGLAALRRRSRSRRRSEVASEQQTVLSSRPPTSHHRPGSRHDHEESYLDEKYSEDSRRHGHTWRDRFVGAAAGLGALAAVKSLFNRKKRAEEASDASSYSHPPGGATSVTQTDLSRIEEGRAPASPGNAADRYRRTQESEVAEDAAFSGSPVRRPGPRTRRSGDSISESWESRESFESIRDEQPGGGHGLRDGIAALGVLGFIKHKLGQRKKRQEEVRVEEMRQQDIENERIARMNSQRRRSTGDGTPLRAPGRRYSDGTESAIDFRGSNPELSRHSLSRPGPITPQRPTMGSRIDTVGEGTHHATGIPPPPHDPLPVPTGGFHAHADSDSEIYASPSRRPHRRHSKRDNALAGTGAAVAGAAASRRAHSRPRPQSSDTNVTSPPVSVKVKMHKDGRHVTLRRLNEAEAAAERDARRRERRRAGSLSSVSGDERWRRTERMETQQAAEMEKQQQYSATSQAESTVPSLPVMDQLLPGPPPGPPPVPKHQQSSPQSATNLPPPAATMSGLGSGLGSGGSPFSPSGTEQSNYDSNRRRRRAERAQARLARGGGTGSRVEFT